MHLCESIFTIIYAHPFLYWGARFFESNAIFSLQFIIPYEVYGLHRFRMKIINKFLMFGFLTFLTFEFLPFRDLTITLWSLPFSDYYSLESPIF